MIKVQTKVIFRFLFILVPAVLLALKTRVKLVFAVNCSVDISLNPYCKSEFMQ